MSELESHKALIKEITDRANDMYYDTKVIANAVYWILEQMADRKTEPQTITIEGRMSLNEWRKICPENPQFKDEPQTERSE